jgi:hypothetical protein
VQYKTRTGNGYFERFTRYVARHPRPLGLRLYVYREAVATSSDPRAPRIVPWRLSPLPPPVVLSPDPYAGMLEVRAASADAARAWLCSPRVATALREALTLSQDLRITDEEVELLGAPYETSLDELTQRLRAAAAIAHAFAG